MGGWRGGAGRRRGAGLVSRSPTCTDRDSFVGQESAKIRAGRVYLQGGGMKTLFTVASVCIIYLASGIRRCLPSACILATSVLAWKGKERQQSRSGGGVGIAGYAITSMLRVCLPSAKPQSYSKSPISLREESPSPPHRRRRRCGGLPSPQPRSDLLIFMRRAPLGLALPTRRVTVWCQLSGSSCRTWKLFICAAQTRKLALFVQRRSEEVRWPMSFFLTNTGRFPR